MAAELLARRKRAKESEEKGWMMGPCGAFTLSTKKSFVRECLLLLSLQFSCLPGAVMLGISDEIECKTDGNFEPALNCVEENDLSEAQLRHLRRKESLMSSADAPMLGECRQTPIRHPTFISSYMCYRYRYFITYIRLC